MPLAAPNAIQQTGALKRLIDARSADGVVNLPDVQAILAQAKKEHVQVGELGLLRAVGSSKALTQAAKDWFVPRADQLVPAGAPTAQMAAIIFRLNPDTGRKQLLSLLDNAKNPVAGGPKTYVITGLGRPYLAAITTGQTIMGLTKFMDGASPAQATKIRGYLRQQLQVLQKPLSQGGLAVPSVKGSDGIALAVDSRVPGVTAVNQNAIVLRALEKIAELPGPQNAKLAAEARAVGAKLARDLKAQLDICYPANGRLAYGLRMRSGRPEPVQSEDGDHLKTTYDALKSLKVFGERFQPVIDRLDRRLPELKHAGAEDLDARPGKVYTDAFNTFRLKYRSVIADGNATAGELKTLDTMAKRDGLLSPGEKKLIAIAQKI